MTFIALMVALANILSFPPIAMPVATGIIVHFTQLPILISGILVGPVGGLVTEAAGGLYMGFVARIPFIIGELANLGFAAGLFSKRLRPFFSGVLAWLVQAPYVVVTDYVWFTIFLQRTPQDDWIAVTPIVIKLTIEAIISSALAEVITRYLKRTRMKQHFRR